MAEQNRQWKTRQDGLDKVFQTTGPVPKPGDGEVLVRIKTVSLNYRDTEGNESNELGKAMTSNLIPTIE